MSNENTETITSRGESERSLLDLLQGIKDGSILPTSIDIETRRIAVEYLYAEGYSILKIASLFGTCQRTISRDRKVIRKRNAISRDPDMVEEVIGEIVKESDEAMNRIRRYANEKGVTPKVKMEGESRRYKILDKSIYRRQSLGFLPFANHQNKANVANRGDASSAADLLTEFHRILPITQAHLLQQPELKFRITAAEQAINQLPIRQSLEESPQHEHHQSKRAA
jgi:hypothetical protein